MKRRDLLTAALAAPALGVPMMAEAETETPVMALFREWKRIDGLAKAYIYDPADGDDEDEVVDRLFYNARDALEDRMMKIPSESAQDMAAKMLISHCFGEMSCLDFEREPVWAEARALVGELESIRAPETVGQANG